MASKTLQIIKETVAERPSVLHGTVKDKNSQWVHVHVPSHVGTHLEHHFLNHGSFFHSHGGSPAIGTPVSLKWSSTASSGGWYPQAPPKGSSAEHVSRAGQCIHNVSKNECALCRPGAHGEMKESTHKIKVDAPSNPADFHHHRICVDTVRNPMKGVILGGPSAQEAEEHLRNKYGYSDKDIEKLKEEAEPVNELSKKTLTHYFNKSMNQIIGHNVKADPKISSRAKVAMGAKTISARKLRNREYGAAQAYHRLQKKKNVKEETIEESRFKIGDRVQPVMGVSAHKQATVVDPKNIKTDGRGVPTNVSGAYKPVDWKQHHAVQYDNGELDYFHHTHLSKPHNTVLGNRMSRSALEADTDQSDREYIAQRQRKARLTKEAVNEALGHEINKASKDLLAKAQKHGNNHPITQEARNHYETLLKQKEEKRVSNMSLPGQIWQNKLKEEAVTEQVALDEASYTNADGSKNTKAIHAQYLRNEDENRHSENAVLLAKHFGTSEELGRMQTMLKTRNKIGFLHSDHHGYSAEMSRKYYKNIAHHDVNEAYSKTAVDKAIGSSNRSGRKIGGREAKLIHRLLKGRQQHDEPDAPFNAEPHKAGTKVRTSSGEEGHIDYVHVSPPGYPHSYKVVKKGATHGERLENGNFISHNRLTPIKEELISEIEVKKGAFHRWLGKSLDQPITDADISKGLSAGGHAAKMAEFAKNFRK